jgi:hypothetical protein
MNQEIYNKFKTPDIVTVIKVRRLQCHGHVVRLGSERTVKKLLECKTGGRREKKKGGPRLRWMEDVKMELKNQMEI